MKSNLQKKLNSDAFVITAELFPPKGVDVSKMLEKAKLIKPYVDAVNITDCQRAIMRTSSLALSKLLLDNNIEPVYQITLRDRNSLALQSDILGASVLGIENILVISGDYPTIGDHKSAKPVYEIDTVEMIKTIKNLENGFDRAGKKLKGVPSFFLGSATNPSSTPYEISIDALNKKFTAGSQFFQTQPIFSLDQFLDFSDRLNNKNILSRILVGVMLLKSYDFAKRISFISGIYIPDEILDRLKNADNELTESINITAELIKGLKKYAKGVHIMAIGIEENIPEIVKRAGIKPNRL